MKSKLILCAAVGFALVSCRQAVKENSPWIDHALDVALYQAKEMSALMTDSLDRMPRTLYTGYNMDFLVEQMECDSTVFMDSLVANPPASEIGKLRTCNLYDWTSGFFPGTLWYLYELTGNDTIRQEAVRYTNRMYPIRKVNDNHDIGFMMNCSYGNALRLDANDTIKAVLIETADNLCSRFNARIGCIRSWDFGPWNYPVIIDNMMNLELLFNVGKLTGDPKYKQIAVQHAKTTMKNHFRPDFTSWHVVSYNNDGSVEKKQTHQGKNDDSSWSRGQSWAVYGYTLCYRETRDSLFLRHAVNVADMIMKRNVAADKIPYWDFDAPVKEDTPRDASAAAVIASAFLELSTFVPDGEKYFDYAESILKTLSSDAYLAGKGKNGFFILMHSTGSLPHGSEIDAPLNYADYYYLEGLKRYVDLKKQSN